ncbi:hypothetical protein [Photobacterium profundum]|uniref:Uncharacterized protein n=1 Tax=Photobacterium profundum (strain SS9) TaxID=298386 RepID=Q6LI36_PHOPR|nr:hypothetical protein [Photobacterium profundum]CAG23044.1 hypothetical protein PBPRB1172 [Photobacterium profundum SS9]
MELQQCWMRYLKAEQLMEQGHWPEAHHLYSEVLNNLPAHIHLALEDENIKPCQFSCLLIALRDATVAQSSILNRMGQYQNAFAILNQSYALLQFISLETSILVQRTSSTLNKQSDDLLRYMGAFCIAQCDSQWMAEYEQLQKAHHYFAQLKVTPDSSHSTHLIN